MSTSGNSQPPHNDQGQAPLIEHLIELRSRLMKAVVVILVIFLGLYAFANDIYSFVAEPLMALLPEGSQMIATEVASPFMAPFKLTLVVAVFIAIPFVLHQAWAFIAPGLYDNEKHLALPLLVSSIALFSVLTLAVAFAPSAEVFIVLRFLAGLGLGATPAAAPTRWRRWGPASNCSPSRSPRPSPSPASASCSRRRTIRR